MCPHALIPFKPAGPKSQLSGILSPEEREAFARAMLEDVIAAAKDANCSPVIVATELYDSEDIQVTIADKDLSGALNEVLSQAVGSVLILMADLPLATGAGYPAGSHYKKQYCDRPRKGRGNKCDLCGRTCKIPRRLLRDEFFKAPANRTGSRAFL